MLELGGNAARELADSMVDAADFILIVLFDIELLDLFELDRVSFPSNPFPLPGG